MTKFSLNPTETSLLKTKCNLRHGGNWYIFHHGVYQVLKRWLLYQDLRLSSICSFLLTKLSKLAKEKSGKKFLIGKYRCSVVVQHIH